MSIALALTACSGNPVDDAIVKKTTTASTNKTIKKVTRKVATVKRTPVVVAKANIVTSKTKKAVMTQRPAIVKKRVVAKKPTRVARAKKLSRAESRAKKISLAALGKSKQSQTQARLNYARAQARKKDLTNQRLEINKLNRVRQARQANYADANHLGLDRFTGSQADVRVVRRPPQRTVRRTAPIKLAAVTTRAKQPVKTRSRQPVATRAKQPVRTRARQPVVTRAKQAVRTRAQQQQARVKAQQEQIRTRSQQKWLRAKAQEEQIRTRAQQQWVRTRAQQQARSRSRQPVRSRGTQYATRTNAPARNIRPVSLKRNANRARSNVRKAVYKRPAQRRVSRIDPNTSFGFALSNAAIQRTKHRVRYDGKYVKIAYPWGDVPKSIGVCTDVVIRAYRRLGIDLQQEVHKDISQDFYAYPNLVKWGLKKPDPNIDHRRVYNLQAFFKRHKAELPRSRNPRDYKPGDLVTWMVGPNFPHIGVVVNRPSKADPNRLMIAHNIGYGPQVEDILFRFPMTGHYRYTPANKKINPSLLFAKTPAPASVLARQRNNGMTVAEMLQASKILSGEFKARSVRSLDDLLAKNNNKNKSQERIMLAHLDSSLTGNNGLNQDALKALLK